MKLFNHSFARRKANKKRRNTDADEQSVKRCKCPIYAVEYKDENKKAAEPGPVSYRRVQQLFYVFGWLARSLPDSAPHCG